MAKKSTNLIDTSNWRPISSAPRDGTPILVCETGNGEEANVLLAAFMSGVGQLEGFWGAAPTSRLPMHLFQHQAEANARGLPVGWRSIAMTALCWKPLPEPEAMAKLRRRESQILAHKYPNVKAAAPFAEPAPAAT